MGVGGGHFICFCEYSISVNDLDVCSDFTVYDFNILSISVNNLHPYRNDLTELKFYFIIRAKNLAIIV